MTELQGDSVIAAMYSQQTDLDTMTAGLARVQSIESAAFVALAVLIGFVVVMWLTLAMQGRQRGS